jgi:predicted amidohydrolase YtcJ
MGGAKVCFMKDRLGLIEVGKWADVAVLDKDLLSVALEDITAVQPVTAIVAGRMVWNPSE